MKYRHFDSGPGKGGFWSRQEKPKNLMISMGGPGGPGGTGFFAQFAQKKNGGNSESKENYFLY